MTKDSSGLADLRLDRDDQSIPSTRRRRFTVGMILLLALAVALVWYSRGRPPSVVAVPVVISTNRSAPVVLNASGYVVARREATVSSKITGKVEEILLEEGMRVEENQVLARLDSANIRVQIDLAVAELEAARGALAETRAQLHEAERQHHRTLALETDGVASQSDLDRTVAQVDSLKARLAVQELEVTVAQRRIDVLKQQLEDTVIRAPFAGVAVSKNAQPGEMISPISAGGGFTRTGIGTIVDMDSLEIEVDVNESYLHRVTTAQPAEAVLDAYPDWKIPCRVLAIIPTADRQKATVRVRVAFDRLEPRILPQMGVRVAFIDPAPMAPGVQESVIPRATLQGAGLTNWVWAILGDRVQRRDIIVEPGEAEAVTVQTGLALGDTVVLRASRGLKSGDRVRVMSP